MKPYWLVMAENSGPPTVQHATQHSAEQEAERLARQLPGRRVFVLMCVAQVLKQDVHRDRVPEAEIPF